MPRPGLADQQALLRWADTVGSRSEFPRLIRRLILETGAGVVRLGFPAGEGISAGSWDGTVRATGGTAFVPAGVSLWELSVEKSVGSKADRDYNKRTETADGTPTNEAVYVAGSLRRWRDREDWSSRRSKEGRWKDVRGYGVDAIETWLESAPVTHAWISELLGYQPHGVRSAETWWAGWSSATTPTLSTSVVLAGRASGATELRDRLARAPQLSTLRAGSLDEVLAFIAAVAIEDDLEGNGQLLARLAFVDDVQAWRALVDHPRQLALVPLTPDVIAEARSAGSHHVTVPLTGTADADMELPPIDIGEAAAALRTAGIEDERRADAAGRLARRSLLALRRHLASKPELHTPTWATPPVDRTTRALLLAGSWRDGVVGDQRILEELVGRPYDEVREQATILASEADPLLTKVDQTFALVSAFDSWRQLRGQLQGDDLRRFASGAEAVLLEVDPRLDLPKEDRWWAGVQGKVRDYSGDLRSGLAATIALLGVHGDSIDAGGGATGASWASGLVRRLLERANEDSSGFVWSSLADILPLMAEGAPDAWLDGVRRGLQGTTPVLAGIFTDDETTSALFTDSPHTGLLWGLELLAWSPEHFGQVIDLLARLADVDPGGRLSNRPSSSLLEIFCPWHPENNVSIARRLDIIDGLRDRHADIAWGLMLKLLPEHHGVHSPTYEPRFREWKPPRENVKTAEYLKFTSALVESLIEDAGDSPAKWQALLDKGLALPPADRLKLRTALCDRVDQGTLAEAERAGLWEAIRSLVAQHREFAETDWALPADELVEWENIERKLAPAGVADRLSWLFEDHWPDLGGGERRDDYEAYSALIAERRRSAIAEVEQAEGIDAVLGMAKRATVPFEVGTALARVDVAGKHEDVALRRIASDDQDELAFAAGYFSRRFLTDGWASIEQTIAQHEELTADQKARLLLSTHDFPAAWERSEAIGADVGEAFWKLFVPLGLGADFEHVGFVARSLMNVSRPAAALRLLTLYVRRERPDATELAGVACTALEALLAAQDDPEFRGLSGYDFESMFDFIEQHKDAVGRDRVARLEWACLPALGIDPRAETLHEALASGPAFFVEVLSKIYRRKSAPKQDAVSPEQQRVGTNAYRLLSSWMRLPGTTNGGIDGRLLNDWVSAAYELLDAADRREVGETNIGHVLAFAPPDADGAWPCREVRDLLEALQSDRIEQGIHTQLVNNRGTTSRDPEEGGEQERKLVEKYRSEAQRFADRWPRTAAILRDLASMYEHDARREEHEAEKRRLGLDP